MQKKRKEIKRRCFKLNDLVKQDNILTKKPSLQKKIQIFSSEVRAWNLQLLHLNLKHAKPFVDETK